MIDQDLKPYLIEINTNPALFTNTQAQKLVIPNLLKDTIHLIIKLNRYREKILKDNIYEGFDVLINRYNLYMFE